MWFRVSVRCQGTNRGWAFLDSFHGDVQDVSPQALVAMVEVTLAVRFGTDAQAERDQLRELWQRVRPCSG
jgi:hypothetical protein